MVIVTIVIHIFYIVLFSCKSLEKYKNISEKFYIGSGSGILGLLFSNKYKNKSKSSRDSRYFSIFFNKKCKNRYILQCTKAHF